MRLYRSSGSFVRPGAVASTVLRRANPSSVEMGGVRTSFFAGGLPLSPSAAAVDWEPAFSGRYGSPADERFHRSKSRFLVVAVIKASVTTAIGGTVAVVELLPSPSPAGRSRKGRPR